MYTLFLALGLSTLISVVPALFGVSAVYTVLPGTLIGIFAFVIIGRRISKRVEMVTRAADAEMAKAQNIASRSGAKAQSVMMRAIDTSVARLKTGMVFAKWQIGVTTMLNARIGMMLYTKALLLQQGGKKKGVSEALKSAIPYLEASQVKGKKGSIITSLMARLGNACHRSLSNR